MFIEPKESMKSVQSVVCLVLWCGAGEELRKKINYLRKDIP